MTQPDQKPSTPPIAGPDPGEGDGDGDPQGPTNVPTPPLPVAVHARVADNAAATDPSILIRRLSRLGLGALLASGEATRRALGSPEASPSQLTDAGLGALALAREASLAAGRATADAARQAASAVDPVVKQVAALPALSPLVDSGRNGLQGFLGALGDAGRAERQRSVEEAGAVMRRSVQAAANSELLPDTAQALANGALPDALDALLPGLIDQLANEPELLVGLVNGVMDRLASEPDALVHLADRLVDPVIGQALPVTLDALNDETEAISRIVRAQSGGLADEMANSFRARGVSADDAVDRVVGRLKRPWRRRRAAPSDETQP